MGRRIVIGLIIALLLQLPLPINAAPDKDVSFNFENADIKVVLVALSRQTGLNIIPGKNVEGNVTAKVDDLPVMDAVYVILKSAGYGYVRRGDTIVVLPEEDIKEDVRSFTLQNVHVKDIEAAISKVISTGESMSVSHQLNTVTVMARPEKLDLIAGIIAKLDAQPIQVLVKAKILEITKGQGDTSTPSSLGGNLIYRNSNGTDFIASQTTGVPENVPASDFATGISARVIGSNVEGYLSALERRVGFNVIASPWIMSINHEESNILIGSKFGYRTTITTQTGTSEQVDFLEVGVKLKFTPHISDDGYIRMVIEPSVSEGSIVDGLPQENTTESKNIVVVKDGQTIVIGGLSKTTDKKTVSGVPILSGIPLVGGLFSRTEVVNEKREIMVLITPEIVTPGVLALLNEHYFELQSEVNLESRRNTLY